MIRELISIGLGIGIVSAAYIFVRLIKGVRPPLSKKDWLGFGLIVFIFVVSRHLPTFADFFGNKTVVQHAVGGGVVSMMVFEFIRRKLNLRVNIFAELILLFVCVSALGCANEIIEATATWSGLYTVDGTDVWSDIYANTAGALIGWGLLRPIRNKF